MRCQSGGQCFFCQANPFRDIQPMFNARGFEIEQISREMDFWVVDGSDRLFSVLVIE